MAAHLDRIEALNPRLNAIVALRPREVLLAEAAAADAARPRGWLHGLPFAVKDLVATAGIATTWGSPLFAGHVPAEDELLAGRLRAAGAILIGKTNTPEFGLGSHTFNAVHGVTRNPYDPERSAGGSSGGAAAALAARLVPVADGSDMMGSLRNPPAFCNVYGFRPSFGLVPGDPGAPGEGETFLHTISTEGPMARTVEDLARLLEVLAGPDPRQPFALAAEPFAEGLDADIAGCRIGWLGDWGGALPTEPGILGLCEAALSVFEALGARVEPVPPPMPFAALWQAWTDLRSWAIAAGHDARAADPAARARMKPELLWEIDRGRALSALDVHRASVVRSAWFARLAGLLEHFDALALPAAQVWPFPADRRWPEAIAGQAMDSYHRWMAVAVPVALAGVPCLALPAGFGPAGLPTGLQLFGPKGADRAVLRLGQAYHRATDWPARRPPPL
jgi:amidase